MLIQSPLFLKNTTLKIKVICCLFICICGVARSQNLEEQIYNASELFIANKNEVSYQRLMQKELEFKTKASTKDEHLALVFLQCNKAFYLQESNQLKTAISSYEAAWKRFNDHHLSTISDYDMIEYCLKPLGNLYTKTNNYTSAENTIQQYIALAQTTQNKDQYIAGIINLSALYQSRGMHASVVKLIEQTRNISEIDKKQSAKLNSLKAFSDLSLKNTGDTDFSPSTEISIIDNPFTQHRLAYQRALKNKDYENALKEFLTSKEWQQDGLLTVRELAKRHVEEAQLYYVINNLEKSNAFLQSALKLLLPNYKNQKIPEKWTLYAENTLIDIFDLLARLQNDGDYALAYYDLSFYVADLLNTSLTSQESKLANQIADRKRSEWCIALLFDSYEKNPSRITFQLALYYADHDKAAVLQDNFRRKSLLSKHPNDSLLLQERTLFKKQEHLTDLLIKTQLGYQKPQHDSLNKQLLEISITLRSLSETIAAKYNTDKSDSVDILQIMQHLKRDRASLINFFYGNNAIYKFDISSKDYHFSKIELQVGITKKITDFIQLFDNASVINNNVKAFTSQAFDVYQLLGLDKVSKHDNLIIIPDGLLHFVPFEALLTKPSETTNFSKMPYLVNSQNVIYNSNLNLYLNPQTRKTKPHVLGVFPVFEHSDQPLSYSVDEAESIKKLSKSKVLMRNEASKTTFLREASNYNVLHLSTHATGGDFTNPASISFYDQPMLVNELYSMDIHPQLVVLSACETGVGKLQKGEGAMSIARGFQYAGAKNILFSLWQINDASTAQLMSFFYDSYDKSNSANDANRQSKLDYLQDPSVSNVKKSPYYWSSFVYYGQIDPVEKQSIIIYYFIGLFALIIVLLLMYKKRKNKTHEEG